MLTFGVFGIESRPGGRFAEIAPGHKQTSGRFALTPARRKCRAFRSRRFLTCGACFRF